MQEDVYTKNLKDLELFFNYYCKNKHAGIEKKTFSVNDKAELSLCPECEELFNYAHNKLSHCELHPKPKCRNCVDTCYDKDQWKKMAKVMKYSGMRLGLIKLRNKILFQ